MTLKRRAKSLMRCNLPFHFLSPVPWSSRGKLG
jgi:hypothetical protein